jgi:hypothetical protein
MKKTLSLLTLVTLLTACAPAASKYEGISSRELLAECTTDMATEFHIHSHLTILVEGEELTVPTDIGIDHTRNCMSSVHTHNTSGVIHVEAPVEADFTLGDFFYNWDQPFDSTQVLDYQVDETHGLKMYVNGQESKLYDMLVMQSHDSIVLDYYLLADGPSPVPEDYTFAANE